jgi:hypothetical protein
MLGNRDDIDVDPMEASPDRAQRCLLWFMLLLFTCTSELIEIEKLEEKGTEML